MDVRRAFFGTPGARRGLASTIAVAFALLFLIYAAYWRSPAAYMVGANTTSGAVLVVAPALAVVVHYYGDAVLYTFAAALVPPVASLLARAALGPWSAVKGDRIGFLRDALLAFVGLGLAVGVLAVAVGSALRRWTPPSERPLSERFFGPPEGRRLAYAVIVVAAVLAAGLSLWLYATYPTYQPFAYAVFGVPVAALVYFHWRGVALAWLGDAAVVLGHSAAIAVIRADLDYVADPGLLVPALTTAISLGSLAAGAAVVLRELYAVVSHRLNTAS
ncbi:hypothetical protein [Halobaculum sp. D14]|uniref:hypothetical protein n=1 Tax=Halobaculum sp. D14 TaxID=3421642 RepID=UPI003EB7A74B